VLSSDPERGNSALEAQGRLKVSNGLKDKFACLAILWVLHQASLVRNFQRVLVLRMANWERKALLTGQKVKLARNV
jgi:hypothetical protein